MDKRKITEHAHKRMQQRGINDLMVRLICEFGVHEYQKGGAYAAYLSHETIDQLRRAIDKIKGTRVILGIADQVITVMHADKSVCTTDYAA